VQNLAFCAKLTGSAWRNVPSALKSDFERVLTVETALNDRFPSMMTLLILLAYVAVAAGFYCIAFRCAPVMDEPTPDPIPTHC
jgi:hypothetical protein